jgi:VWFA-related protein
MTWTSRACAIGGILMTVADLRQAPGQAPVFRATTQVVTVQASVLEGKTPVEGLSAEDFVLLDNGVRQRVEVTAVEATPLDVTLVFDENYFSLAVIGRRFDSNLSKIAKLLRPTDRLRVIGFATNVREIVPMREVGEAVTDSLKAVAADARLGAFMHGQIGLPGSAYSDVVNDPDQGGWSLFDALVLALAPPAVLERQHLVVAFSVGMDRGSTLLDGRQLVAVAERADAVLHVALWNQRRGPIGKQWRIEGLREHYSRDAVARAALATGGGVHDAADVVGAFKSIFNSFRQSYRLRYTVTGVPTRGWHTLTISLPRSPKYTIQARKGYMGR